MDEMIKWRGTIIFSGSELYPIRLRESVGKNMDNEPTNLME